MPELKILNSKEIKEIFQMIENQWGAKVKLDYGFLKNNKNRVFIVSKDISKIDFSKLRLNSIGMYFCEIDSKGIRLSIEGTQIVGPKATKNIIELDEEETKKWFKGEDLEKECKDCNGFVILKNQKNYPSNASELVRKLTRSQVTDNFFVKDFLGCGKYKDGKILNYVGKSRRVNLL